MMTKLPDALRLASVIVHECGLFLNNDDRRKNCAGIFVEVLI